MSLRFSQAIARSRAAQALCALVLSVLCAAALVREPLIIAVLVGALVLFGLLALVISWPHIAVWLGTATLALFPFVASPHRGPITFDPGILILIVVLVGIITRGGQSRGITVTGIDVATGLLFLAMLLSVLFGVEHMEDYEAFLYLWGVPYLVGRTVALQLGGGVVTTAILVAAAVLLPFVLYEAVTNSNLFLHIPGASNAVSGLGETNVRLGATRVQAGFGQPILLAMFLSTAAILAVARGVRAGTRRGRVCWLGFAAILALIQTAALSRIGWVLLAIGVLWLSAGIPRLLLKPGRVGIAILAVAAVLSLGTFSAARELLVGGGSGPASQQVAESTSYRSALLSYALEPGVLRPFGSPIRFIGPGGNPSIDDEYIALASGWGYVAGFMLLAVLATTIFSGWRFRRDPEYGGLWGVTIGSLIVLYGVGLLTQEQVVIWLLVGACAGVAAGHRRASRSEAVMPSLVAGTAPRQLARTGETA